MKRKERDYCKAENNELCLKKNAFSLSVVKLGKASLLTKGTGHMGAELFGKWGK